MAKKCRCVKRGAHNRCLKRAKCHKPARKGRRKGSLRGLSGDVNLCLVRAKTKKQVRSCMRGLRIKTRRLKKK